MAKGIIVRALGGFDKKLLIVARGLTPGTPTSLMYVRRAATGDIIKRGGARDRFKRGGGSG